MNFAAVLTKEYLLNFDGRTNRAQFWAFFLIYLAGSIVAGIVDGVLGTNGMLGLVFALAALYPSICVSIKRWHDRDKSGWWVLISLIPVIGWIWAFVETGCLRGTEGGNRFGPDPLARA